MPLSWSISLVLACAPDTTPEGNARARATAGGAPGATHVGGTRYGNQRNEGRARPDDRPLRCSTVARWHRTIRSEIVRREAPAAGVEKVNAVLRISTAGGCRNCKRVDECEPEPASRCAAGRVRSRAGRSNAHGSMPQPYWPTRGIARVFTPMPARRARPSRAVWTVGSAVPVRPRTRDVANSLPL